MEEYDRVKQTHTHSNELDYLINKRDRDEKSQIAIREAATTPKLTSFRLLIFCCGKADFKINKSVEVNLRIALRKDELRG